MSSRLFAADGDRAGYTGAGDGHVDAIGRRVAPDPELGLFFPRGFRVEQELQAARLARQ